MHIVHRRVRVSAEHSAHTQARHPTRMREQNRMTNILNMYMCMHAIHHHSVYIRPLQTEDPPHSQHCLVVHMKRAMEKVIDRAGAHCACRESKKHTLFVQYVRMYFLCIHICILYYAYYRARMHTFWAIYWIIYARYHHVEAFTSTPQALFSRCTVVVSRFFLSNVCCLPQTLHTHIFITVVHGVVLAEGGGG